MKSIENKHLRDQVEESFIDEKIRTAVNYSLTFSSKEFLQKEIKLNHDFFYGSCL